MSVVVQSLVNLDMAGKPNSWGRHWRTVRICMWCGHGWWVSGFFKGCTSCECYAVVIWLISQHEILAHIQESHDAFRLTLRCICDLPSNLCVNSFKVGRSHFLSSKCISFLGSSVMFWPFDLAKNAIQGDAPEGSDTF